jgi:hypothetical protein
VATRSDRLAARAWTRWSGFGNGRGGEIAERLTFVVGFVSGSPAADLGPSVPSRVRHARRGRAEVIEAMWIKPGQPRRYVTVAWNRRCLALTDRDGEIENLPNPFLAGAASTSGTPRIARYF